ncbi:MAG: DUF4258 domain-containing protein [Planctomycetota bacterium]|nr:DUF4258 domain-containing protein [Planctomycetota bacterium]
MDKGKRIIFSRHAKERMVERRIVEEMVEEAMFKGEHKPQRGGRRKAVKVMGSYTVNVIYAEHADFYYVVTVTKG